MGAVIPIAVRSTNGVAHYLESNWGTNVGSLTLYGDSALVRDRDSDTLIYASKGSTYQFALKTAGHNVLFSQDDLSGGDNSFLRLYAPGNSFGEMITRTNIQFFLPLNIDTIYANSLYLTNPMPPSALAPTNSVPINGTYSLHISNGTNIWSLDSNTNLDFGGLDRLNFWLDFTNSYPITVLAVGDSLAVSPSMSERVAVKLQERFGTNGYVSDSMLSTEPYPTNSANTFSAGHGSSFDSSGTNWMGRYWALCGNGESIAYGSHVRPNGYYSDQVQLFWISHAGGGTFDLQIKANGGAWTTIKSLTGFSASRTGGYTNVAVSVNYNRFRVINTEAKTNYIIWTAPYYSSFGAAKIGTGAGVRFASMGTGGISMNAFTNVPAAIKDVILTNLNPALIISHNLEEASPTELQWLPEYFRWLNLKRYSADRVLVLPYDFGFNLDPTNSYLEREMWYTNALANGFATFDSEKAVGGFANMFTNQWSVTNISNVSAGMASANPHPNTAGQIQLADKFLERFDIGRHWLVSDKSPPSSLALRVNGETNSPLRVYKSDASGSSVVNLGGQASVGYVGFGTDGNYLLSGVFGTTSGTWLNSPSSTAGPYFQRGSGGTSLGNFDSNGRLYLNIGLNAAAGTSNYLGGTAVATSGFGSRSNLYVIMPTNAAAASYGIIATGVEGGTTAHTKWQALPQFELVNTIYTNAWSTDESGLAEFHTNYFTYSVPSTANYQVNLSYITVTEGGGLTVDSVSDTVVKWIDPFASAVNVSPNLDTKTVGVGSGYNNGSVLGPYVVFAKAGTSIIVSNYTQNSYDGGGDTKATNFVMISVRGAP